MTLAVRRKSSFLWGLCIFFFGKFIEILMIEKGQESKPKVSTINKITMMPKEIMSI